MKDCCKTGNGEEKKKSGLRKWFNYIVYVIIASILIGALLLQIIGS